MSMFGALVLSSGRGDKFSRPVPAPNKFLRTLWEWSYSKATDRHWRFGLAVVIAESEETDDSRCQVHQHETLLGQIEQHAERKRAYTDAEVIKALILRHRLAAALRRGLIHRKGHQCWLRGADAGATDYGCGPKPGRRRRKGEQEKAAHVHDQTGNDHSAPADAVR